MMIKIISLILLSTAGFVFGIPKTLFPKYSFRNKIFSFIVIFLFLIGLIMGSIDTYISQQELRKEKERNKAMEKNILEFDSTLCLMNEILIDIRHNSDVDVSETKISASSKGLLLKPSTVEMESKSTISLIQKKENIQLTKIPELSKYRKHLDYYLCFIDSDYIWPMINLYGSSRMRSLRIPQNFEQGSLCVIKVDDNKLKESFDWYIYNNLTNKNKLPKPDYLNIIQSININKRYTE